MFLSRKTDSNGVWVTPDLVEKANPYHDSSGRFTSRGNAGKWNGGGKVSDALDNNGRAGDLADRAGMSLEQGVSMIGNMPRGQVDAATMSRASKLSDDFNSVVSGSGSTRSASKKISVLSGEARSLADKMPDVANRTNFLDAADDMAELGGLLGSVS
jgi:hypothetical protein